MKKFVLLIIVFAAAGFLAYKLLSDNGPKPVEMKDQALKIGKNSDAFNTAFALLLKNYYSLADALVQWDSVKANEAAYMLAATADSLPLQQLKADSGVVLTARSLAASVSSEAKGFTGETGMEARRRAFNMLTDELYNLFRTVRYDGAIVYHIRCTMPYPDSSEGYWLSNAPRIVNPYLGAKDPLHGDKMIGDGVIEDSLNFAKK
jgi:hypothetical protein